MTATTAIMICGHGSCDDGVEDEFNKLAKHMRERLPEYDVESCFLGHTSPVFRVGLEKLIENGIKKIVCVPGMSLNTGHVENDLPSEINNFASLHPKIEFICAYELAIDPKILTAARDRIEECEVAAPTNIDRKETLLMVVGHGANDADANSNVYKVTRMLWEGMGFGWAEVSYSSGAFPLVDQGMKHAMKLGYKRIIVFPYFLFSSNLIHHIYVWADEAQAANPDVEVLNAPHLNDHLQLLDCLINRIEEALVGSNALNCLLCKYREQIISNKGDEGTSNIGHHHHVSGTSNDGNGSHAHGAHHDHLNKD
jgi:sirohydrochlorin cobaltochelatase